MHVAAGVARLQERQFALNPLALDQVGISRDVLQHKELLEALHLPLQPSALGG
jgi:hypothetical protein